MRYLCLLLSVISVFYFSTSFAFTPEFVGIVTGAESAVDYCSGKLGSYSLYYDADHPLGTTTACIAGGTTTVSVTGVGMDTASTANNMTPGGTYGVYNTGGSDKYLSVPATGITTENGRIEFDLKTPAILPTSSSSGLVEWYVSTSASIYAKIQQSAGSYRLLVYHYDGTTSGITAPSSYTAMSPNTTYHVVIDWSSTTGNVMASFLGSTLTSSGGTVGSFTTPTQGVTFGERNWSEASNSSFGVDNIVMGASQQ